MELIKLSKKSTNKDKIINNFSISKIWLDLIEKNCLGGYESKLEFYHMTNLEIFKKLKDL